MQLSNLQPGCANRVAGFLFAHTVALKRLFATRNLQLSLQQAPLLQTIMQPQGLQRQRL